MFREWRGPARAYSSRFNRSTKRPRLKRTRGAALQETNSPKGRTPMWNKTREDSPGPRPVETPSRTTVTTPPPATSSTRNTAVIGPSMTMKGEIRTREELVVEGEVEGSLESHSSITIGANGKVKANIKAREVAIFGAVK